MGTSVFVFQPLPESTQQAKGYRQDRYSLLTADSRTQLAVIGTYGIMWRPGSMSSVKRYGPNQTYRRTRSIAGIRYAVVLFEQASISTSLSGPVLQLDPSQLSIPNGAILVRYLPPLTAPPEQLLELALSNATGLVWA